MCAASIIAATGKSVSHRDIELRHRAKHFDQQDVPNPMERVFFTRPKRAARMNPMSSSSFFFPFGGMVVSSTGEATFQGDFARSIQPTKPMSNQQFVLEECQTDKHIVGFRFQVWPSPALRLGLKIPSITRSGKTAVLPKNTMTNAFSRVKAGFFK